jgi:pimeloyl-ACP methyl ester carboxylesterase
MARWNSCNILHLAPDAKRLWQFDAKGGGFALGRELRVPHAEALPGKFVAKNWSSLWQPKLNVAWLPPESVFLRVVELPASNFEETLSMVELQLEKLSPLPVTQIVWTMHVLGTHTAPPKGDGVLESLQTVVVVIAERSAVEEFAGRLEREGYLADRLETPMLDQLEAIAAETDGAWLFPFSLGGQVAALVAIRSGGALRNLSFVTLPPAGERAGELKAQLAHIAWSGELEGWLNGPLKWHLVADAVNASEWETVLRGALGETVSVIAPPAPAELAARTARRAAAAGKSNLLPEEFSVRYHQQFVDRLWLRGLAYAGAAYAVICVIYFCATAVLSYRVAGVEKQVAALGGSYTNSLQLQAIYNVLKERSQLKYAALDCWQWVAEELPPTITLQRFSFGDGQRVTLGGTAPQDQVNTLFQFNTALKKKKVNGQFVFDQQKGDTVSPRFSGNVGTWNFSLELVHAEAAPQ